MTARVRLTTKTATEGDVYNMNDARAKEESRGGNGSGEAFQKEYALKDNTFGEEVLPTADTAALNKKDVNDRNEVGMGEIRYAFQQSIKNARELDDRAAKCLTAAERILPGAHTASIEATAMDLMFLPTASIDSLLSRQAALAQDIVKTANELVDPSKDPVNTNKKPEEITAGEKGVDPFANKPEGEEPDGDEAPKAEKKPEGDEAPKAEKKPEGDSEEVTAMKKQMDEMKETLAALTQQLGATAGKNQNQPPFMAEAATPAPGAMDIQMGDEKAPALGAPKMASEADLLDSIFSAAEPVGKRGAAQLSGMVRKASDVTDADLSSIWGSTPDVSAVFR